MLCLGLKKSLSSPRLKLTAQGMAQCTNDQSLVWYHSAIRAPPNELLLYLDICWWDCFLDNHSSLSHWTVSNPFRWFTSWTTFETFQPSQQLTSKRFLSVILHWTLPTWVMMVVDWPLSCQSIQRRGFDSECGTLVSLSLASKFID